MRTTSCLALCWQSERALSPRTGERGWCAQTRCAGSSRARSTLLASRERSYALAGTFGLLGVFLAIQASRVQFVFDKEALEVLVKGSAEETEARAGAASTGRHAWSYQLHVSGPLCHSREPLPLSQNAFVGGRNRWPYRSFVNWELWWPGFPVLVYFKETQTKPEGQIHFFPVS